MPTAGASILCSFLRVIPNQARRIINPLHLNETAELPRLAQLAPNAGAPSENSVHMPTTMTLKYPNAVRRKPVFTLKTSNPTPDSVNNRIVGCRRGQIPEAATMTIVQVTNRTGKTVNLVTRKPIQTDRSTARTKRRTKSCIDCINYIRVPVAAFGRVFAPIFLI
jgi:hypothetical protein